MKWEKSFQNPGRKYTCSYCGALVGSSQGWKTDVVDNVYGPHRFGCGYIYLCPQCDCPTYFDPTESQFPAPLYGESVVDLPPDIEALYNEARRAMSVNSFTAAAMCCRKLLMNIAVEKGAPANQSYQQYVDYLVENHLPPDAKDWVNQIREIGNEANHEIKLVSEADAKEAVGFVAMLLKLTIEYSAKIDNLREP